MDTTRQNVRARLSTGAGFTLVELLVVITIIGILVALITVAASGALKRGRQTAIKVELDQISTAFENYKQDVANSFPPNLQTDDTTLAAEPATSPTPLDESQVFDDLKRHLKQAFPRHRESDDLLRALVGLTPNDTTAYPNVMAGGITAGEAIVFWLGGFSSDPKYPISGEGGPSYAIPAIGDADNYRLDPIESRRWVYSFEVARLEPRDEEGYFDDTAEAGERFIEYTVTINGQAQARRINFWQYVPRNSTQPFLYFDTSRHIPATVSDPPAATDLAPFPLHVHAVKKRSDSVGAVFPVQFVNPNKFQILHAGIDDDWGAEESFELMSAHGVLEDGGDPTIADEYLLYPDGPFTQDVADTIVNFTTGTLEDSQR